MVGWREGSRFANGSEGEELPLWVERIVSLGKPGEMRVEEEGAARDILGLSVLQQVPRLLPRRVIDSRCKCPAKVEGKWERFTGQVTKIVDIPCRRAEDTFAVFLPFYPKPPLKLLLVSIRRESVHQSLASARKDAE